MEAAFHNRTTKAYRKKCDYAIVRPQVFNCIRNEKQLKSKQNIKLLIMCCGPLAKLFYRAFKEMNKLTTCNSVV